MKNIGIYPMLPTKYSAKKRKELRLFEKMILKKSKR